jgi:hypothetical protein
MSHCTVTPAASQLFPFSKAQERQTAANASGKISSRVSPA